MESTPINKGILIASTLTIFWSILLLVSALSLAIPSLSVNKSIPPICILGLILSVSLFVSGMGLRRSQKKSARINILFWVFIMGLLALMKVAISYFGILFGLGVILLTLINWKDLK